MMVLAHYVPNFIKLYAYNGYILIIQKVFLNKAAKIVKLIHLSFPQIVL